MKSYGGIFHGQKSRGVFSLTRISLFQLNILSFLSVCHYYRQYRCVLQQGELAQMLERSLSVREVLGSDPDSPVIGGHIIPLLG